MGLYKQAHTEYFDHPAHFLSYLFTDINQRKDFPVCRPEGKAAEGKAARSILSGGCF